MIRTWRKGNPDILLVEMEIDSAFTENKMENLQNNKNKTTNGHFLVYIQRNENPYLTRDIYTPMFIGLFTIAKITNKAKVSTVECLKKM